VVKNLMGRDLLGDVGIGGRIILNWALNTKGEGM
jgi:hypothetical protein